MFRSFARDRPNMFHPVMITSARQMAPAKKETAPKIGSSKISCSRNRYAPLKPKTAAMKQKLQQLKAVLIFRCFLSNCPIRLRIKASEFEHVARIGRVGTIECVRFFVGHAGALVEQFRTYFREPNSNTRPHEGHILATRRPFSGCRPIHLSRSASAAAYAISVWPKPGAPLSISLMSCISVSQSGQCVAS